MFKKNERGKIKNNESNEDNNAIYSIHKGLLIFCIALLAIIIALAIAIACIK